MAAATTAAGTAVGGAGGGGRHLVTQSPRLTTAVPRVARKDGASFERMVHVDPHAIGKNHEHGTDNTQQSSSRDSLEPNGPAGAGHPGRNRRGSQNLVVSCVL